MNPLRELFNHHIWATRTLLEHCRTLPEADLQSTVPGTYGTILATFAHLVSGDQRYLEFLTGAHETSRIGEAAELPLVVLQSAFEVVAARWPAVVDAATTLDVTIPERHPYQSLEHAEDLLFVQAINHGNDHRTQICTILSAFGATAPDLDGWSYWSASRG